MRLPRLVEPRHRDDAVVALRCYYGRPPHDEHGAFLGARFDAWDSLGTRARDADRFTADDLVAASLLDVAVAAPAAVMLLDTRADAFCDLLAELGPDRDLVTETEPWPADWVGWRLWAALMELPGVDATTASTLYARKRPRLRPLYDSVVHEVIRSHDIWAPLRARLQEDPVLHPRLVGLGQEAGLPPEVSALRVFDVLAEMDGKRHASCGRR